MIRILVTFLSQLEVNRLIVTWEISDALLHDLRSSEKLYELFARNLVSVFYDLGFDLLELQHVSLKLFSTFLRYIHSLGVYVSQNTRPLLSQDDKVLLSLSDSGVKESALVSKFVLRMNSFLRDCKGSQVNVITKIQNTEERIIDPFDRSDSKGGFPNSSTPTYNSVLWKYLAIASFIAAHNHASNDVKVFSSAAERPKSKRSKMSKTENNETAERMKRNVLASLISTRSLKEKSRDSSR